MKSRYRAVILGVVVVGASAADPLAKPGWTDIALLEREVPTAGSSSIMRSYLRRWHLRWFEAHGAPDVLPYDPAGAAIRA